MVRWYDPGQLARTGVDVLVSTLFGRHGDKRLLEALADGAPPEYAFDDAEPLWIDYVADTGDGWNSTYAVAAAVGAPELRLGGTLDGDADGGEVALPRGRVLVFGGDEVYPVPSPEGYERRLVRPYRTALPWVEGTPPNVFAIPGNHDWYDMLVSFSRLFCTRSEATARWIGGWRTRQARSYFALKLPGGWWLLGTDVQLGADIDEAQVAFFRGIAGRMQEDDRVILCNAVPEWIYREKYGRWSPAYDAGNLRFLEEDVLRERVAVVIAGDSHYYRRHATPDGRRQRIVAGGGGAFTHPTHDLTGTTLPGGFELKQSFPEPGESRRYCWWNLLFPFLNPRFAGLLAAVYLLTAWILLPESVLRAGVLLEGLGAELLDRFTQGPGALLWLLVVVGGFWLFTDTHSKGYRYVAGPLHGVAHVVAACLLGAGLAAALGPGLRPGWRVLLWLAGIVAGGWLVGGLLMGLYLLVSLNVFGRHANEAFSALRCPDWKCFLRMRIDPDGTLTIHPVGLRRVPRRWRRRAEAPLLASRDARARGPALIEAPIVLRRGS